MAAETNILVSTSLDVISKQRELVQESLGADGVYIRMKETLQDILDDGEMKIEDKSKIISETIAGLSASITQNSMNTALKWAAEEVSLALKKEELQYQLDVLSYQRDKLAHDADAALADKQLKQAQIIREYGAPTTDVDANVISLADDGVKYAQQMNTEQDTANKVDLNAQIEAQTEEVYARTHKTVADTYVNHGVYTWTGLDSQGLSGVSKAVTGYTTLSDMNKYVANEQAKGYAYNAWSNAATGSGGMVGTLIAAENPDIPAQTYTDVFNTWLTTAGKLRDVVAPNITL